MQLEVGHGSSVSESTSELRPVSIRVGGGAGCSSGWGISYTGALLLSLSPSLSLCRSLALSEYLTLSLSSSLSLSRLFLDDSDELSSVLSELTADPRCCQEIIPRSLALSLFRFSWREALSPPPSLSLSLSLSLSPSLPPSLPPSPSLSLALPNLSFALPNPSPSLKSLSQTSLSLGGGAPPLPRRLELNGSAWCKGEREREGVKGRGGRRGVRRGGRRGGREGGREER